MKSLKSPTAKNASRHSSREEKTTQPGEKAGTLYLVPLPIGNLGDITQRGIGVLKSVHTIAAEDTRNTGNLLRHFDIRAQLLACHDHNEQDVAPKMIAQLQSGQSIALVSDAGSPLVSDPGYRIVQAAIAAGIPMTALPGPNAVLPALQLSGLPPHPFYFHGFLPVRSAARQRALRDLAVLPATLIFYEAPHRLADMLLDAEQVFGEMRRAAVVREISKIYEEARRETLHNLRQHYEIEPPKGEIVVVIEGQKERAKWEESQVHDALRDAMAGGATFRDAVEIITTECGWAKKEVYDVGLVLKSHAEK